MSRILFPELPQEWGLVTIGEIAQVTYGKALPFDYREDKGDVPVYGSGGSIGVHDEAMHPGPSIIIGRKGTVGAVHYVPGPFWCIDTALYLSVISPLVNIEFLSHLLQFLDLSKLTIMVGVPGISRKDIESQQIPVPSPPEQQRIVDILRQADELRMLRQERDEKVQKLLLALFYDIFGPPSSWQKMATLEQLVDFVCQVPESLHTKIRVNTGESVSDLPQRTDWERGTWLALLRQQNISWTVCPSEAY